MKIKFIYYLLFPLLAITIKSIAQTKNHDSIIDKKTNNSIFIDTNKDSVVYPKVYWNLNDKKKYKVSATETKTEKNTVSSKEKYSYNILIEVEKIYQNETIIKWSYRNITSNSESFFKNPFSLVNNVSISFKIDQDGRFLEYTGLEQTVKALIISSETLENKYLDQSESIKNIKKNVQLYANKENITKLFDKDIRQFHLFFGKSKFILHGTPYVYESYMDNLFSKSPTPAKTTIKLNEISPSHTNYIIEAIQEANKEWLTNSWFTYLKDLATKLESQQPSEDRLNDDIKYNMKTTSRIKDNGWISYSIETKKVKFQDTEYIFDRRFELTD